MPGLTVSKKHPKKEEEEEEEKKATEQSYTEIRKLIIDLAAQPAAQPAAQQASQYGKGRSRKEPPDPKIFQLKSIDLLTECAGAAWR